MSRSAIWLGRQILGNIVSNTVMTLNHFELEVELSRPAFSASAVRFSLCAGSGF
jgi:hypothetical protein